MINTTINLGIIKKIATALGDLNERVVYVGGAVVSLYADDPAADDVRPTKDLDISLEISSASELEKLREQLTAKGFVQKTDSKVICRFWYEEVMVDVMATEEIGWAPANEWFAPGFQYLVEHEVEGTTIKLLSLPFFLASKFAAYNNRGKNDARTSKDFEDIVYLLNNNINLGEEILAAPQGVREYLKSELLKITDDANLQEAIRAHLYYETQEERYLMIIEKINIAVI